MKECGNMAHQVFINANIPDCGNASWNVIINNADTITNANVKVGFNKHCIIFYMQDTDRNVHICGSEAKEVPNAILNCKLNSIQLLFLDIHYSLSCSHLKHAMF
jgi:hypothetical protein